MWSSPTAAAAFSASRTCCFGRRLQERDAVLVLLLGRVADPRAREAVGLQLGAHAVAVFAGAVVGMLLHDPGDVLHVVAVLVGEHVELGERPGGRVEPLAQQREERRIDVHRLFGRAVERTGRVRGRAALRRGLDVDDDQLRLAVAVDVRRPVLVDGEGCRSQPAVVAARSRRHRSRSSGRSSSWLAAAGSAAAEQTGEVAAGEEIEQEDGDRAESGDAPPPTATPRPRRRAVLPPTLGVVVERHGFTVPRGHSPNPPKAPEPLAQSTGIGSGHGDHTDDRHHHRRREGRSATPCCSGSPPARCSGRTARCGSGCSRSRRGCAPPRAPPSSCRTARSRCCAASTSPTIRTRRSTAAASRSWSGRVRAGPAWSAPTCSRRTPASSRRRAPRSTRAPPTTCASSWWATPPTRTRSSPRHPPPTCPPTASPRSPGSTTTARSVSSPTALDARPDEICAASRSGATTPRRSSRMSRTRRSRGIPVHRRARREARRPRGRRRRGSTTSSSRGSPSAAPRSSRCAARRRSPRRPTRRSSTCATSSAGRTPGPRPPSSRAASTGCRRGWCARSR